MSVDDALRAAGRLYARRPTALLPYYLLVAGATHVARLPVLAGVLVAYADLSAKGRLAPVVDELAALNPERLDPAAPTDPTSLPPDLVDALGRLATPTVLVALATGAVGAVVLFVLARAVAAAGAFSAVEAGLRGADPLPGGTRGIARRWRSFVGAALLRYGLLALAALPGVAGVGGLVAAVGAAGPVGTGTGTPGAAVPAAAALALAGILVSVALVVAVALGLAFLGPALVVDDVGAVGAVRRSVAVPFERPVTFVLYVLVLVGGAVALGTLGGVFTAAGASRVTPLVTVLVGRPLLDAFAVAVYGERSPAAVDAHEAGAGTTQDATTGTTQDAADGEGPATPSGGTGGSAPVATRVRTGLRDGLRALGGFLRGQPVAVLGGVALLGGSAALGYAATAGYGVRLDVPADPGGVFGPLPVGTFLTIAANNWLVAAGAGFAGLAGGLPTVGALVFNGLLVGALAGVIDPTAFLALVGPHGVIELPAIGVAGGLGLHLGRVGVGAVRGTRSAAGVSAELARAWRVLVGLAAVLVVAAFVEAFVTPRVAAAVLGG